MHDELSSCLRAWRERLDPAEAGAPPRAGRRTPGLRREDVAALAGVSVNYLTRLEQGRAQHPSASVVAALARALRLSSAEAEHLHRAAGHALPRGAMRRHVTPSVQRVLDRLGDVPVLVQDAAWTVQAANRLAEALMPELALGVGRERNVLWRHFTGLPMTIRRTAAEDARFEAEAVADLHAAAGRHPDDPELRALVADLQAASPRFASLWRERPAAELTADRKTFAHPEAGPLALDCDVLAVAGSDLRLVVYTAAPGTPDARALELVGVLGHARFDGGDAPRASRVMGAASRTSARRTGPR